MPSPQIHFEVHGKRAQGSPLILSHPLKASPTRDDPQSRILRAYVDRLTDRYRVLVMDYPSGGKSEPIPAEELTADRACADMLRVADLAGFERFAWWGYSWGGVLGLQLASRTDRVAALVCGGWSPLGSLHRELLRACRALAGTSGKVDQTLAFYTSLQDWPEAESVRRISCPKLAYAGSEDEVERGGVSIRIGAALRERRGDLEQNDWHICEIPGRDHSVWTDAECVLAAVRPFLDRVT
jgi:pimeloyl-ACP methyl ester carboxylesterase